MFERLNEENDRRVCCCLCGRLIPEGEKYILAEHEAICGECADRLEVWQVLEMLELNSIVELFDEKGKARRT